jgi:ribosomal protein S18 acetylase RimI-like enzyme
MTNASTKPQAAEPRVRYSEADVRMEIRPATPADLDRLRDIDATVESSQVLFLERTGEGIASSWKLEARPLREKLIDRNALDDERAFTLRQIVTGVDEGVALVAEHEGQLVAVALAQPDPARGTMRVLDIRIDYDFRREGLGTVIAYQIIEHARQRELRAVVAETRANNFPANQFFQKLAFDLSGFDTSRHSNHDLVKESATLIWYAKLD